LTMRVSLFSRLAPGHWKTYLLKKPRSISLDILLELISRLVLGKSWARWIIFSLKVLTTGPRRDQS
jgi:hypothetical protein